MIKRFCDMCEKELIDGYFERGFGKTDLFVFEVMVGIIAKSGCAWNNAMMCQKCFHDAIRSVEFTNRSENP
jgi:hypothetical protein